MSRRSRGRHEPEPRESAGQDAPPGRSRDKIPFLAQVGLLVAVFAVTVGIAELAGAVNLGTSFGIAQIVFAIVLVFLLLRA